MSAFRSNRCRRRSELAELTRQTVLWMTQDLPSDGSSPIRPIMRKSSLAFASLPAREPLTSNKSLGPRTSRTATWIRFERGYYNRHTGGKSLGQTAWDEASDDDRDTMDVDEDVTIRRDETSSNVAAHSKTYTQRLHDQISMLGKSQSNGPQAV